MVYGSSFAKIRVYLDLKKTLTLKLNTLIVSNIVLYLVGPDSIISIEKHQKLPPSQKDLRKVATEREEELSIISL